MVKHEEHRESDKKSAETMQEIIESLTENKLSNATRLEDLKQQISAKEKSLNELQNQLKTFNTMTIENEALKRQLKRLSDENDSLLSQMESLDSKPAAGDEVHQQMVQLNEELSKISKQYEDKARETKSIKELMDNNSAKIRRLIQENSELKEALEMQSEATPSDQVKIKYDKCIKKLKLYREKIFDISEKFKLLKADREVLVGTTREYSAYVSNWQKEIANASIKMIERIRESNKQLRLKDEETESLKKQVENLMSSSDTANTNDKAVKNLEAEVQNLKEVVKLKDKSIEEEKEAQKKLRQSVKKTSVLDLEMEAYEKTLDELNRKLEAKKLQVIEYENTIKMQNDMMESLKSQIASLEANLDSEKSHSLEIKRSMDSQLNLLRQTEHERTEANLQLELLNKNYEALKLENGEIKLDMAKHVGDIEKRYQALESERNELIKSISFLEIEVDKFKKLSSSHESEIEILRTEFASYKIRAQGVLRQSQTKDLSKEQELQDEVVTMQKSLENFKEMNSKITSELESLKKNYDDICEDKVRLQGRCKDLLETLERQSDEVLEESRKRNQQYDESTKAYQLQIDTLNAFYKKKIQESELNNNNIIAELHKKVNKLESASSVSTAAQVPIASAYEPNVYQLRNEEHKMSMLLIDREEAEGSEDQSSQSSTFQLQLQPRRKISRGRELMPLDELLNSSFDDNSNEINEETISNFSSPSEALEQTKSKLMKEANRVAHLTTLLADAEKDLARMQQLNELLKEEVRRQQRNFDREEHIKNSEYLKNIIVKFVTLNNGDEKQRLIPVLNTILKLSSEENNLLQNACKSGWAGVLWSK